MGSSGSDDVEVEAELEASDIDVGSEAGTSESTTAAGMEDCTTSAIEEETAPDNDDAILATVEEATTTLADPFSIALNNLSSSLKLGRNLVHQNAIRMLRSRIRCLRMKRTTRRKKTKAEMRRTRSSQSDFSRAVMRCFEVDMTALSVSC